jgi:hypothetical protein
MLNISFSGDVIKAQCECHAGQFVGRAFLIENGKLKQLAHTYFVSEEQAAEHLDGFVFAVADEHLKRIGLSVESAKHVTVVRDNEAETATQKSMNQSNPNLH